MLKSVGCQKVAFWHYFESGLFPLFCIHLWLFLCNNFTFFNVSPPFLCPVCWACVNSFSLWPFYLYVESHTDTHALWNEQFQLFATFLRSPVGCRATTYHVSKCHPSLACFILVDMNFYPLLRINSHPRRKTELMCVNVGYVLVEVAPL